MIPSYINTWVDIRKTRKYTRVENLAFRNLCIFWWLAQWNQYRAIGNRCSHYLKKYLLYMQHIIFFLLVKCTDILVFLYYNTRYISAFVPYWNLPDWWHITLRLLFEKLSDSSRLETTITFAPLQMHYTIFHHNCKKIYRENISCEF